MSGGRRKSKHPQKWEEFDYEEIKNKFNGDKAEDTQNLANSTAYEYVGGTGMSQKLMRNADICSRTLKNDSSDEEDLGNSNGSTADGEMTILDVLQGSRQGLLAECKACCFQLKDWSSAISHIQSHRLVFIPDCAKRFESVKVNRTTGPTCLLCQKVCQSLSELVFHVHVDHSASRKPLMCPFCGTVFPSTSLLQQHVDIRDVCMKCPVCSATYDQEYELYAHLSDCLPTFHPHLRSLICHVCDHKIDMTHLADHLINHSLAGEVTKNAESKRNINTASRLSEQPQTENDDCETRMFLCEICDRRFSSFGKFQTHLNDHAETKMYCPLCFLKGFEKIECMIRHLMMRCPRRSHEQFEFGNIISAIGKEHKLNFVEVLRKFEGVQPFREGLLTWSSIPVVEDALRSFQSLPKEEDRVRNEPTDIELLLRLNQLEREPERQRTTANLHPSLEEISKNYPGVTVIRGVNFSRLKRLQDEAKALEEKDYLSSALEKGTFPPNTFLRLEWEAQYLRYKEPFYVPGGSDKLRFSPLKRTSILPQKSSIPSQVSPQVLEKLKGELEELQEDFCAKNQNVLFDKVKLHKLLLEAKDG